jgi:hypothetical protein
MSLNSARCMGSYNMNSQSSRRNYVEKLFAFSKILVIQLFKQKNGTCDQQVPFKDLPDSFSTQIRQLQRAEMILTSSSVVVNF